MDVLDGIYGLRGRNVIAANVLTFPRVRTRGKNQNDMLDARRFIPCVFLLLVVVYLAASFRSANTRIVLQQHQQQQQEQHEVFISTRGARRYTSSISMSTTAEENKRSAEQLKYHPDGTSYIMCGACKTAYVVEAGQFDKGGQRVRCSVCDKEWFQNSDRVQQTDSEYRLADMPDGKVAEVKQILADRNFPKYPRGNPKYLSSLHFTSFHFTSFHFISLHFTSLHFTSLHFIIMYVHIYIHV